MEGWGASLIPGLGEHGARFLLAVLRRPGGVGSSGPSAMMTGLGGLECRAVDGRTG